MGVRGARVIPLSVLDLAPIVQGGDAALAFQRSRDLAQHVERSGYRRFWLAEHHGMPGIASAATAVVIALRRKGDPALPLWEGQNREAVLPWGEVGALGSVAL